MDFLRCKICKKKFKVETKENRLIAKSIGGNPICFLIKKMLFLNYAI